MISGSGIDIQQKPDTRIPKHFSCWYGVHLYYMTRRKKKNGLSGGQTLVVIAVTVCLVLWLSGSASISSGSGSGSFLFFLIAVVGSAFFFRHSQRVKAREALIAKAQYKINEQIGSLARRRSQLVQPDSYGKPQLGRWTNEIDYFINQHIAPMLIGRECAMLGQETATITWLIENRVQFELDRQHVFREFSSDMSPAEFEAFCAEELRRCGWVARVTSQSRDQGVDVVAEKSGMRVVLQCKLYTSPVGNKAVQEVVAARAYEQANYGVVITNNAYTSAAQQLAIANKVWLLHYSDLQNLENILKSER